MATHACAGVAATLASTANQCKFMQSLIAWIKDISLEQLKLLVAEVDQWAASGQRICPVCRHEGARVVARVRG